MTRKVEESMAKYQFLATHFYNVDDTGISTAHEPNVIVARKGRKLLGEKQLVSLFAASAGSSFVSPTSVYLRHRENTSLKT